MWKGVKQTVKIISTVLSSWTALLLLSLRTYSQNHHCNIPAAVSTLCCKCQSILSQSFSCFKIHKTVLVYIFIGYTCSAASDGGQLVPTWSATWTPQWWWEGGRTRWWWGRGASIGSSQGAGKQWKGRSRWPRWQTARRRHTHIWPHWSSSTDGTPQPTRTEETYSVWSSL